MKNDCYFFGVAQLRLFFTTSFLLQPIDAREKEEAEEERHLAIEEKRRLQQQAIVLHNKAITKDGATSAAPACDHVVKLLLIGDSGKLLL